MSFFPSTNDAESLAAVSIDVSQHRIHDGIAFRYHDSVTLGAAGTQDYLITTPNSAFTPHFTMEADGVAITTFDFYEATDKTGTTLQTVFNCNRNSATSPTLTIHKGTSGGTTDGTKLSTYSSGAATGAVSVDNSQFSNNKEWVLKSNTKYIFRITSGTAGNLCNVEFNWESHAPGTL